MATARPRTVQPWVAAAAIAALAAVGSAGTCAELKTNSSDTLQSELRLSTIADLPNCKKGSDRTACNANPSECPAINAGFIFYDTFNLLHEHFGSCSNATLKTKTQCDIVDGTWTADETYALPAEGCHVHDELKVVVYDAAPLNGAAQNCMSTVTKLGFEKVFHEDDSSKWQNDFSIQAKLNEMKIGLCEVLDAAGHDGHTLVTSEGSDGFVALLADHADTETEISVSKFEGFIKQPPFEAGWFLFYIFGILYLFCGIAIVCDDFFTASLEQLSIKFELSEDVAGATFMAAGSSAPELFTSLAAVMFPDPCSNRSSVGIGTIVGSAIFNILIIIGATAMLTTVPLQLSWRPLVRDTCWYAFSIAILVVFVMGDQQDDKITGKKSGYVKWWEGLIMTCCYCLYIVFMKFNTQIMGTDPDRDNTVKDESVAERVRKNSVVPDEEGKDTEAGETDAAITKGGPEDEKPGDEADDDDGEVDCLGVPKPEDFGGAVFTYFSYFWYLAFMITIPNCEPVEEGQKPDNWCHKPDWYAVSFANSIVWIGVICWGMVECAVHLGEMLGISATVMGLTVLSAGTSVPDAISSIVVAQRGMGDMAVSNALGSNVFDILLGLGFPYFLAALTQDADDIDDNTDGAVKMCTEDIAVYILCLALVLVCVIGTFAAFKFQLHPQLGYILCGLYVIFAAFAILRDTEVIETGGSCDAGH